jgi:hypothetical protein
VVACNSMKTFLIIFLLLLPFTLSTIAPQTVVHTHAVMSDAHAGHSHHHPVDDNPDCDKLASKNIKTHGHDGQVHEFIKDNHWRLQAQERVAALPIPLGKILISENIKPPLEPPTYI